MHGFVNANALVKWMGGSVSIGNAMSRYVSFPFIISFRNIRRENSTDSNLTGSEEIASNLTPKTSGTFSVVFSSRRRSDKHTRRKDLDSLLSREIVAKLKELHFKSCNCHKKQLRAQSKRRTRPPKPTPCTGPGCPPPFPPTAAPAPASSVAPVPGPVPSSGCYYVEPPPPTPCPETIPTPAPAYVVVPPPAPAYPVAPPVYVTPPPMPPLPPQPAYVTSPPASYPTAPPQPKPEGCGCALVQPCFICPCLPSCHPVHASQCPCNVDHSRPFICPRGYTDGILNPPFDDFEELRLLMSQGFRFLDSLNSTLPPCAPKPPLPSNQYPIQPPQGQYPQVPPSQYPLPPIPQSPSSPALPGYIQPPPSEYPQAPPSVAIIPPPASQSSRTGYIQSPPEIVIGPQTGYVPEQPPQDQYILPRPSEPVLQYPPHIDIHPPPSGQYPSAPSPIPGCPLPCQIPCSPPEQSPCQFLPLCPPSGGYPVPPQPSYVQSQPLQPEYQLPPTQNQYQLGQVDMFGQHRHPSAKEVTAGDGAGWEGHKVSSKSSVGQELDTEFNAQMNGAELAEARQERRSKFNRDFQVASMPLYSQDGQNNNQIPNEYAKPPQPGYNTAPPSTESSTITNLTSSTEPTSLALKCNRLSNSQTISHRKKLFAAMPPKAKITDADHANKELFKSITRASMKTLSGYRLFTKENGPKFVGTGPSGSYLRDVAKAWSELPDAEKAKWNTIAADIKQKSRRFGRSKSR
ncbi:hypothetical protein DdX_01839 [Ditylenchus destructor]|uniref:Uncharacterized protein n=1 Tax=Ditylenchus destructor TaxID=166010 RepID=A0AAD4RE62_9BILA|nr:hypothetical protein DdX_01839 [Ditylenchus destructor]